MTDHQSCSADSPDVVERMEDACNRAGKEWFFFHTAVSAVLEIKRLRSTIEELRAADRDHLAAKNGMEKRLTDEIERLRGHSGVGAQPAIDCRPTETELCEILRSIRSGSIVAEQVIWDWFNSTAQTAAQPPAAPVETKWECMGRKQALPEPGECNWPDCGCDPHAMKVIESLIEQGWQPPEAPRSSAGNVAVLPVPQVEIDETSPIVDLVWRSGGESFSIVVSQSKLVGIHCTVEPPRSNVAWTLPLPDGLLSIKPEAFTGAQPQEAKVKPCGDADTCVCEIVGRTTCIHQPSESLQCLRCGTVDAFGPVSKEKK